MKRALLLGIVLGFVFVVLGLGLRAYEGTEVSGMLSATEQEADEGYFALGRETMIVARPGSSLHVWLRGQIGQRVTLSIAPDKSE